MREQMAEKMEGRTNHFACEFRTRHTTTRYRCPRQRSTSDRWTNFGGNRHEHGSTAITILQPRDKEQVEGKSDVLFVGLQGITVVGLPAAFGESL